MKVIGITGGVGSGKSRVLELLEKEFGAELLVADRLAHQVMEPGEEAYREVAAALGSSFLKEDGSLDRAALAKRIFGDPRARETVNGIVHPRVWQAIEEGIRRTEKPLAAGEAALFDPEHNRLFDQIWYVWTSEENRIARLMENRGYSREKCRDIMASQLSEAGFRAMADQVIDNNGSLEELRLQLKQLLGAET